MAKKKKNILNNPGIMMVVTYLDIFLVNALILYIANRYYPNAVVLGTGSITLSWSLIHSMGTLALINVFAIPFIREWETRKGKMLTSSQWMIKYFLINFVGLWLLARHADNLGMGLASWKVVVVLAILLDIAQGIVMMKLEKMRTK